MRISVQYSTMNGVRICLIEHMQEYREKYM